ncbi:MAG: hypothetical protein DRJ57_00795 [Thermoprotei archaeon]|nr:MAG: hypothetical protein DRJ57_00795 [Thermoprotei archaeon]
MALILDTRFLIAHTFPPTREDRERITRFTARVLGRERLLIPGVVAVEYIKVAGRRLGRAAAVARLSLWLNSGAEFTPLSKEAAMKAGELLLKGPDVPTADAIIAATALTLHAKVVTDDPHFDALGIKRIWYR